MSCALGQDAVIGGVADRSRVRERTEGGGSRGSGGAPQQLQTETITINPAPLTGHNLELGKNEDG